MPSPEQLASLKPWTAPTRVSFHPSRLTKHRSQAPPQWRSTSASSSSPSTSHRSSPAIPDGLDANTLGNGRALATLTFTVRGVNDAGECPPSTGDTIVIS